MNFDLISLLILCATIVAAFLLKINSGVVAIAVSLVLARCAGIADKTLISFFDNNLFIMLLGVMLLFGIAQENGTLELLAKKILALCGGKVKLFPPILFLVAALIAAIGPGPITVSALMAVITIALAKETNVPAMRLLPFGALGSFAGGLSPITPTGIVGVTQSEAIGLNDMGGQILLGLAVANFLYAVILYFFVFRWHSYKVAPREVAATETGKSQRFNLKQWFTLGGIAAMAALTIFLKINIGLAAFAVSLILIILRAGDEGVVLKKLSWGTLIMITGVGILISLVTELGGIDLLSATLNKFMTEKTAAGIITALAGVMSWVSSASGVVMPTLIPTVPELGANAPALVIGICAGAHAAAISPLSSCGGLMLAAYSSGDITAKERNKAFGQLFLMSAGGVAFCAVLGLLGLYNIF
ncbi:MAG: hypothetical protein IJB91_06100 [Oscillospiraceae bacterium]|nr:hypothetical protein [Oscillospiraceae bacterium]